MAAANFTTTPVPILATPKPRQMAEFCYEHIHEIRAMFANSMLIPACNVTEFGRMLRMPPFVYEFILNGVSPLIKKQDTNYRKSISCEERLSITLKYFATGESPLSLAEQYRVGRCTIGRVIKETSQAIYSVFGHYLKTLAMFILSFVQRRKRLKLSCLWGRPSFLFPINFVDEVGRRWAFAACYATMTRLLLDFFDGYLFWNPGNWKDPEWVLKFGWVKTFNLIGNVIHLGYMFFPLFACLSLRRNIPANIIGLIYISILIYLDIKWYSVCGLLMDEETGRVAKKEIVEMFIQVPLFIADIAMVICFIYDLVLNSIACHMARTGQEKKKKSRWGGKETLPLQYIEHLMTYQPKPKPKSWKDKIKHRISYKYIDGFKYPPRVICTMAVAFLGLWTMCSGVGFKVDEVLRPIEEYAQTGALVERLIPIYNNTIVYRAPQYVSAVRWSILVANILSGVFHVFVMIHMILTYRVHVLKTMRGDRSWHHEYRIKKPPAVLVAGMRYSGYQIAYILWGYIIMFSVIALVLLVISTALIIPLMHAERSWLIDKIIKMLPTVAASMLVLYSQIFFAKFVFLQERGAYLALNNRRMYHCFCYFVFFLNVIVGVFSVLKRTLRSLFFGIILISRLDRCLMMRGFERFDAGFKCYLAMLEVDVHHNHPILKGFIYILRDEVADSKERRQQEAREKNADPEKGELVTKAKRRIDKRVRNKWWKLITLVNNPSLVLDRLHAKVQDAKKEKRPGFKEEVLDAIADAGDVLVAGAGLGAIADSMDDADIAEE